MGWSASDIGHSSIWHLMACFEGFLLANGVEEKPEPMSLEEYDDLIRRTSRSV